MSHEHTLLFVPGSDPDAIDAAVQSSADGIILDLEDTVGPENKARAREEVLSALSDWSAADPTPYVRINGLDTAHGIDDLETIVEHGAVPEGVLLPDVRGPTEVLTVADVLESADASIGIVPIIERPEALFAVDAIASARQVDALAFGSVDFQLNTGMSILDPDVELSLPRYLVSLAASAAGVEAYDTVFLDLTDDAGLREEARTARSMGYDGKMAIDASQLDPIAEAFAPSEDERERARRVVEAFEETDEGVIFVEGTFVDKPVVDQQRHLLEDARE